MIKYSDRSNFRKKVYFGSCSRGLESVMLEMAGQRERKAERSHLHQQTHNRDNELEGGLKTLKAHPSDMLPPVRLHLLKVL